MGDRVQRRREHIRAFLQSHGPAGAAEIEQALRYTKGEVWTALKGEWFAQHPGPGELSAKWYVKESAVIAPAKDEQPNDNARILKAMAVIIAEHEVMRERLIETQEVHKGLPIRWTGNGEPIVNINKIVGEYKTPERVTPKQFRTIIVAMNIILGHDGHDTIGKSADEIAVECKDFVRGIAERDPECAVSHEQIVTIVKAMQNVVKYE